MDDSFKHGISDCRVSDSIRKSAGSVLVIIIPRQYFKDRELIWHDKIERVVFRVVRIS